VTALVLIVRRRRYEASSAVRREQEHAASRYLLTASLDEPSPRDDNMSPAAERAALSKLLRLVRGRDRDRLLAVAERDGLFHEAIAGLCNGRASRRIDAMRILEQFGSPECVAALTDRLRSDENEAVRLEAAGALARIGALPPLTELVAALHLDNMPMTRLHAALLRSLAKRDAEQLLALAGSAKHPALRRLLVEALGWTEDFTMAEWLARYALDPDPEVRCAAVRAARHLGHPGAGRWLVPLLYDHSEAVRIQACQAAGQLGVKAAVPALERLATEPAWWVRARARAALDVLRPADRVSLSAVTSNA